MSAEISSDLHLKLRNLGVDDLDQLEELMEKVYSDIGGAWPRKTLLALFREFPEGQICIEGNGRVIAVALTVRCSYERFSRAHTYQDLIGRRERIRHDPKGDALYGMDVFVDPDHRGLRLGRRLYDARKELCRNLNLRAILAGGRIINYHRYAGKLTATEYIEAVRRKEVHDPILSFQLANDFEVKRLMKNYLPEDEKSCGFATLLEWNNILYEPEGLAAEEIRKSVVRIGIVQWQMRLTDSFQAWLDQVEFFVDSMADYQADFVLFPEFFNAPLMGMGDQKDQFSAIRFLAQYAAPSLEALSHFAVTYNINLIAGSLPVLEGDTLYNNAYLCRRDGTVDMQPKIHITPHERRDWVIQGGNTLQVFDTDAGRIGILICYDVEFPELSRLLAEEGMEILFVPFWTDTKNGFLRVQRCAQARAIENECYVAIGGSVGNLPQVENVDIQYAQSAIYSPSDFAFPHDAIIAESTPNTEMALIADLDLDKLMQLRYEGSVTNRKDRRPDLYQLRWVAEKTRKKVGNGKLAS
ncbi:bifunctional GNAT family N-acetyltransferase/carbon-nitrogen hydrolase family protein [Nitrosococcus wardiae]|uniref:GNAT family N-acetyltransferase n=1 Tax=Nitrosococcus wardiae TaxID=1814290 RepID=A0A4P7BZU1_9GAMM|nr:bifunctional GNAT family N-acetyltransferase/carbon-nitrogen hydrolase family protein [Nitrosococcus wardiae]QBQ53966.1 GNAT family N-acetyltransferase [Nitrosococcus wardiae]